MNFYTAGDGTSGTRSDDKTETRTDLNINMAAGQSRWQTGPNYGWIHTELSPEVMKYLWKLIKKGEVAKDDYKQRLAGNISTEFGIIDEDNYFQDNIVLPQVELFRNNNGGSDPVRNFVQMSPGSPLRLTEFWVNCSKPGEFNPYHFHGGAYSFAIWMKIPYDWDEQSELKQFQGTKIQDRKVGCFEFEYIDMLGGIRNFAYRLSDAFEGQMVFFPASLRHTVYPFFNIPGKPEKDNGTRISIAGNLWYDTTGMGSEGNYSTILKESAMKNESESYDYSNDEFKNKIDIKKKSRKTKRKGFSNL